jgi:predicted nucleic acid-binding protein
MRIFYVDASAWVKRHQREVGSDWIARFWLPERRMSCATLGLIEVLCTIGRRHAASSVDEAVTTSVLQAVRTDFDAFVQVRLDDAVLLQAESLAMKTHLRGADCIHLASAMRLAESLGTPITLIASDIELLAAARSQGFDCLDPSRDPALPTIEA